VKTQVFASCVVKLSAYDGCGVRLASSTVRPLYNIVPRE
jgi:hypothetical protein